jgi:hypothetical protein
MSENPLNPVAASELSKKAFADNTKYDAKEIGYSQLDDIDRGLRECIELHRPIFDMDEFCVCFVLAGDPLVKNLTRRKFFAMPWLPKPRPNQSVFLYNKNLDCITKRLWVLPKAELMAELTTKFVTDEVDKRQQAWSMAFYEGTFWEYIRHEHGITMLSESESLSHHRQELIQAGCKPNLLNVVEPFDFDKIQIRNFVDPGVTRV